LRCGSAWQWVVVLGRRALLNVLRPTAYTYCGPAYRISRRAKLVLAVAAGRTMHETSAHVCTRVQYMLNERTTFPSAPSKCIFL